jgi:hypothetical protein
VVKGINKRVVVIRPQEKGLFEEAIFIVRGEAGETGCTAEDIIREACRAADVYMKSSNSKYRRLSKIPPPVFVFAGAAVTAIAWIITSL